MEKSQSICFTCGRIIHMEAAREARSVGAPFYRLRGRTLYHHRDAVEKNKKKVSAFCPYFAGGEV